MTRGMPLEQTSQLGQQNLESLLGRHPADREHDTGRRRDAEPRAPRRPPIVAGMEGVDVDAVRNEVTTIAGDAQRGHPVDQLGGAARHHRGAAQRLAHQQSNARFLGEEDVAAVDADRQRHPPRQRPGRDSVGHDPVGVQQVVAAPPPAGGEGLGARRGRRAEPPAWPRSSPARRPRGCGRSRGSRSARAHSGRCARERRRRSTRRPRRERAARAR